MVRLVQRFGLAPWLLVLVVGATIALVAGVLPFRQYLAQADRIDAARTELADIEAQSAEMEARLAALSDPRFIEQVAREQYGLVFPGEKLYVVVPEVEASGTPSGGRSAWMASLVEAFGTSEAASPPTSEAAGG